MGRKGKGSKLKPAAVSEQPTLNDILQILPPLEVRDRIFKRLDLEDKISARSVSKLWKGFVDETIEICPLLFDGSWKEVLKLGSHGDDIRELTISKLQKFNYPRKGLGFSNVRKVKFIPFCDVEIEEEEPKHPVDCGISGKNLTKLFENYPAIEELSLHSAALQDIKCPSIFQSVKLDSLKELKISNYNGDGHGFKVTGDILKNTFPSLKRTEIIVINKEDSLLHIPLLYEDCYRFIGNHANSLDEIYIDHCNCFDERRLQLLELVIDHAIPQAAYLDILEKIDKVQVSSLCLKLTFYEGRSRFQFGIRLLQVQTHLTSLRICNISNGNIAIWNAIPAILAKCSETLISVTLDGCFCSNGQNDMSFSCSLLKYCSRLTIFNFDICGPVILNIEDLPKEIKVLCLGQKLSPIQLDFICKNMKNLVDFNLPQGAARRLSTTVAKITVKLFEKVLKMKTLARIGLNRRTCSLKKIRRFVSNLPEWEEVVEEEEEGVNPDLVKFERKL